MFVRFRTLAVILLLAVSAWANNPADKACLGCHGKSDFSKKAKDGTTTSLFVDEKHFSSSAHSKIGCTGCHSDLEEKDHPGKPVDKVNCATCHAKAVQTYDKSVHSELRKAGKTFAATCQDCHGTHDIQPMASPTSPINRANLSKTCGKCHDDIVSEFQESTHGQAMAKGVREVPSCTSCHSEHQITGLKGTSSIKLAEQVCIQCHASERINTKFGLPSDTVATYLDSYHGLAGKLGSAKAANCASCHGFHRILPPSDPRSSVHPSNLVQTCQKCHPGVGENFVKGKIHQVFDEKGDKGARANAWVRSMYLGLIWLTIGGMLFHNALAWWRKARIALKDPDRTVIRMTLLARLQHAGLALSFIYLVVTGFALKYPDTLLGTIFGANETVRRVGHRSAAIIMILLAVYHLCFIAFTKQGRQFVKDMMPKIQDVRDLISNLGYFLHPGVPRPRFHRFSYAEKAEYWAVVWGTAIMGVTGFLIWFKEFATLYVPRWVVDIAITVHLYEAILATLAIIVWHFYAIFFDPDVYPINWAWLDGRVSKEHYEDEHPLDQNFEEVGHEKKD